MQASAQSRQAIEEPAEPSELASPAIPIAHSAQPGKFSSPPDEVKKVLRQRPGGGNPGLDVRTVSTLNNAGEAGLDAPFPPSSPNVLAPATPRHQTFTIAELQVIETDRRVLPAESGGGTVPAPGAGLLMGLGLAAAARRRR